MAIGRVSGSMLVSNLDRQGSDLQFTSLNNPVVYMDFSQYKLGVGTNANITETLTVNGNLSTSQVLINGLNFGAKNGSGTITVTTPVDFGPVGNVRISGGTSYDVLYTDGAGNLGFANLNVIAGLDAFTGNNVALGSNTAGYLVSNAVTLTTTTTVTDAIALLNRLLGNITNSTGSVITVANINASNVTASTVTVNGVNVYSNISSTAANVTTLQSNAASQATDLNTLFANAATQATSINTINANIAAANVNISALQSNAASQATDLNTLFANAASQANSINSINANVAAANVNIATLQSQVYSNANVASYLTIFNGNINAGNISLSGNLRTDYISGNLGNVITFTSTGAIKLPIGDSSNRPAGVSGEMRFNTDINQVEFYNGIGWVNVTNTVTDQIITPDGASTQFTLDQAATNTSVLVSINGTLQHPGIAYTISGTTITFAEIPNVDDIIDIRYLGGLTSLNNTLADDLTVSGNLTLSGILSQPLTTKSNTSPGTAGQVCWDANYIYVCTATNSWKRVSLSSF